MKIGRRVFLGGLAAASCAPRLAVPPASAADDWTAVRAQFLLSPGLVHLSALILASHPKTVREAIERHRRALDEDPVTYMHANEGTWRMHETAARYMGVAREEIALTDSTPMGLGVVMGGLQLHAGDEIVVGTHDHYSMHESVRLAAERTGAIVRRTPLYETPESATDAEMIAAVKKAITERTRVVAMTWVHSSTGVKIPLRAIADLAHAANARVVVDGVHGFGVESADIPALGCDVFVSGCHKWIFGPRGTGLVWARKDAWPELRATIPAFAADPFEAWKKGAPPPPPTAFAMTPGGYHSFEHRWALPEAFELHLSIGKQKVRDRTHALNRRLKEGLRAMKHVTLRTPLDEARSAGIVCFEVKGRDPDTVVKLLHARKVIATATANTPSYARLSAAIFNTEAEIDFALSAIDGLA
ncbi:MAG: aminotransferase class V-fold PLP-dependent enzyme [Polyangiales bacterium]